MGQTIEGGSDAKFHPLEKQFIVYFDRLYDAGYDKNFIKKLLPQLKSKYNDMVVSKLPDIDLFDRYTIEYIYKIWKYNKFN